MAIIGRWKSDSKTQGEDMSPLQSFRNYIANIFRSFVPGSKIVFPPNLSDLAKEALQAQADWEQLEQQTVEKAAKKEFLNEMGKEKLKFEIDEIAKELGRINKFLNNQDFKNLLNSGGLIRLRLINKNKEKLMKTFIKYKFLLGDQYASLQHRFDSGTAYSALQKIWKFLNEKKDSYQYDLKVKTSKLGKL